MAGRVHVLFIIGAIAGAPLTSAMAQADTVPSARRLYKDGDQIYPAAWSRDGHLLVTVVKEKVPEIRLLTARGRVARSIRGPVPNSWAADVHPSGTRMLVEAYDGGVSDLYEVALDTGAVTRLTTTPWNEWHPSWSPDGQSIVFDSDSGGRAPRLVVLALSTRATARATRGTRPEQGGKWAPNGNRLAFHRHMGAPGDTNYDVFVLDRETGSETQITSDAGDSSSPAWSPDGRRLAFSSNRAGRFDIYVVCADGMNATKVTAGAGDEKYPVWSPDGRHIAYQTVGDGIWIADVSRLPACVVKTR